MDRELLAQHVQGFTYMKSKMCYNKDHRSGDVCVRPACCLTHNTAHSTVGVLYLTVQHWFHKILSCSSSCQHTQRHNGEGWEPQIRGTHLVPSLASDTALEPYWHHLDVMYHCSSCGRNWDLASRAFPGFHKFWLNDWCNKQVGKMVSGNRDGIRWPKSQWQSFSMW